MQAMKLSAALYVGSMVVAGAASAQTAVEWKVSDGGNGHWYASPVVAGGLTWEQARDFAIASGGALSSLETANERAFVFQSFVRSRVPSSFVIQGGGSSAWFGPWIGGYQLPNSPEPLGGWRWLTGEEFNPLLDYCCNNDCGGQNEDRLHLYQLGVMGWNDMRSEVICGNQPVSYLIEWSADCNGDGIVDYGQILSGELSDANANNIPDCCETGSCLIASNGSFEAGTPLNACASETVASGNALGTGWMVTAGSVQRVRASAACNTQGAPKFGDFFVDLLDAGEIRQAIATTPGKSYRLTFWLSGDCAGGPATKRVTASLGSVTQTFEHACVGSAVQAWRSCTLEFIANSAITNLSLRSLAGGPSNGPLVDGVRVEDISISCAGDVDGDGEVGGGDIGLVLLNFGPCPQ